MTDFREAACRQYEEGCCNRGGFCNFMHLKPIGRDLRRALYGGRRPYSARYAPSSSRRRSRSRSRGRDRERDRDRGGAVDRDNSEERRARIAAWNRPRAGGGGGGGGGEQHGGGGGGDEQHGGSGGFGGNGFAPPPPPPPDAAGFAPPPPPQ